MQGQNELLAHVVQHEVNELFKLNASVGVLIQGLKELINILCCGLLVDASLFEMHFEQVPDLVTIENPVAILVEGIESDAHLLDPLSAHGLGMLINLVHHLVLAHEILYVVLGVVHCAFDFSLFLFA